MSIRRLSSFLLLSLLLTACDGDVKESLGLKREAPDEFRVVSRPPLSVPPDFNLRPPSAAPDIGGASASSEAAGLVLGSDAARSQQSLDELQRQQPSSDTAVGVVTSGELATPAESAFLKRAGANEANPKIRETIYEETMTAPKADKNFLERLLPEKSKKSAKEPVVDAAAEKDRLEKNSEAGKPVTEGETPVKETKKGVLNEVFGN